MQNNMKYFLSQFFKQSRRGFIIPLTLLICTIILAIATGVSTILAKEILFSQVTRLSQYAYYAADAGVACATIIDDTYIDPATGIGIFAYDTLTTKEAVLDAHNRQRTLRNLPSLSFSDIRCATSEIFNVSAQGSHFTESNFSYNGVTGKSSNFTMRMDLGGGVLRCADVTVNKTAQYRQIISRGYSSCGQTTQRKIERAVISTTEEQQ